MIVIEHTFYLSGRVAGRIWFYETWYGLTGQYPDQERPTFTGSRK